MVTHSLSHYDYQPYYDASTTDQQELEEDSRQDDAVTEEELHFLQHQMPVRVYQVTAINPVLTISTSDHPVLVPSASAAMRNAAR